MKARYASSAAPAANNAIQSDIVGLVIPLHVAVTIPPAAIEVGLTLRLGPLPAAVTVRLKVVVRLSGLPVTVIGKVPVGVDPAVAMVNVLVQVGLHVPA